MGGDRRQMMDDAADDKIPEGLRILVVDDDRVCLTVLQALLHRCKYQRGLLIPPLRHSPLESMPCDLFVSRE